MSHIATNWAFQQRGLKPSAKIVLLLLADCHNPAYGCFPTQAYIADACELSRATVNVQLATLEELGLIRRVVSIDPVSKRQRPTRYKLAFEDDFSDSADGENVREAPQKAVSENQTQPPKAVSSFPTEPCPENPQSRVQNLDTNHVREPIKEPCVGDATSAAHNRAAFDEFWSAYPRLRNAEKCRALFDQAVASGVKPQRIVQAAKRYRAENAGNKPMYLAYADSWLSNTRWNDFADEPHQNDQGDVVRNMATFWAEKVNAGKYIPPSGISPQVAAYMVQSKMVTADQLRKAGV